MASRCGESAWSWRGFWCPISCRPRPRINGGTGSTSVSPTADLLFSRKDIIGGDGRLPRGVASFRTAAPNLLEPVGIKFCLGCFAIECSLYDIDIHYRPPGGAVRKKGVAVAFGKLGRKVVQRRRGIPCNHCILDIGLGVDLGDESASDGECPSHRLVVRIRRSYFLGRARIFFAGHKPVNLSCHLHPGGSQAPQAEG